MVKALGQGGAPIQLGVAQTSLGAIAKSTELVPLTSPKGYWYRIVYMLVIISF